MGGVHVELEAWKNKRYEIFGIRPTLKVKQVLYLGIVLESSW